MALFSVSIALSALLLFLVQPIIAKQILPWFGGSAGVWTTCMVFFQTALLAGYAYAHWLARRFSPSQQRNVHLALLTASLLCLPIEAASRWRPAGGADAAWAILVLMVATIGLPYFLLASTGPLLQSWLIRRRPAHSVYRLFALSNAGSLTGLIAFPWLIEPHLDSRAQALGWSLAYAGFVAACACATWQAGRVAPCLVAGAAAEGLPSAAAPGAKQGAWLGLSALGVIILLGATAHICQNVASVPFLWLAPLVMYLASFIIAFEGREGRGWYDPRWGIPAAVASAALMAKGLAAENGVLDVALAVPLYCFGVLLTCLFCHGELAARRPGAADLTRFYLMISIGGALGGIFVGLLAPRIFRSVVEFPTALAVVCLAALAAAWTRRSLRIGQRRTLALLALCAGVATLGFDLSFAHFLDRDVILMKRNFYGTLRVRQIGQGDAQVRRLLHGVILHGEQPTRAADRNKPGSYYSPSSGVGLAIRAAQASGQALRLGIIGLGTGTLAAYGRSGDLVQFYELDPDVVQIAQHEFTYLAATAAQVRIELGDARLSLQSQTEQGQAPGFDVLAVDAFSSDAIPVHLLTRQAIALYARSIDERGIIAVHVSNRFLDLVPVVANVAADLRLQARLVQDYPSGEHVSSSDWVLIARRPDAFDRAPIAGRAEALAPRPDLGVWTDQFNDLLDAVRIRPASALRALVVR